MANIGPGVLLLGVGGALFAYSGLKGKGFGSSVQSLLAGNSPATANATNAITVPAVTDSSGFNIVQSNSSGGVSQESFFAAVLRGLGLPVTQGALDGLAGVTNTEGVNGYYNPFNIEWHQGQSTAWKGTGNFNSAGVQEYASFDQGVAATVAFLQQNSGWSTVVAALGSGSQQMVETAIAARYASWGSKFKPAGSNASSLLTAPVGG